MSRSWIREKTLSQYEKIARISSPRVFLLPFLACERRVLAFELMIDGDEFYGINDGIETSLIVGE
jgi:hypothetical protein